MAKGFLPTQAYDSDLDAVLNFKRNVHSSIDQLDLRTGLPDCSCLRDSDVLIAGPPCQGFSTAGKRKVDDERNQLLPLTADLAIRLRPAALVVENVAGALAGEHARYWQELDQKMRSAGYRTCTIRCQGTDLGLAQFRKRVLFFAWRSKKEVTFPKPSRQPGKLRSALAGVAGQANHEPFLLQRGTTEWRIARRIKPGQKLSNVRAGPSAIATWDIPEVFGPISENERTVLELIRRLRRRERQRTLGDADPVSFGRLEAALGARFKRLSDRLISKGYLRRLGEAVDLVGTFNGKFRRLSWDAPSCAVDTRFGSPRYFLHPSEQRGFSVREAARIQGFPDSFVLNGCQAAQFRMIGNAVPPPLAAFAAELTLYLVGKT